MSDAIYERVKQRIDELADELIEVSHAIHSRPELAFKEYFACETLTNSLERHDQFICRSPTLAIPPPIHFGQRLGSLAPPPSVALTWVPTLRCCSPSCR